MVVYAFGIGTPAGRAGADPGRPSELKRDEDGSVVISQLHEEVLEKLARATGGDYLRVDQRRGRSGADRAADRPHGEADDREPEPEHAGGALPVAARPGGRWRCWSTWRWGRSRRQAQASLPAAPFPPRRERREPAVRGSRAPTSSPPSSSSARSPCRRSPPCPGSRTCRPGPSAGCTTRGSGPSGRSTPAEAGKPKEAVGPADTALRLAPDDPPVQYDAGTAHLGAGHARKAVDAAREGGQGARRRSWRPRRTTTWATRGSRPATPPARRRPTSRRCAREPANQNAKYNLELALREEQKQKMGGQGQPGGLARQPLAEPGPLEPAGPGEQPAAEPASGQGSQQPSAAAAGAAAGPAGPAAEAGRGAGRPPAAVPQPAGHERPRGGLGALGGREPGAPAAPRSGGQAGAPAGREGEGLVRSSGSCLPPGCSWASPCPPPAAPRSRSRSPWSRR